MSAARRTLVHALAAWALLGPSAAAAQSVLAAGGLGVPVDPVDARGRALGAVGPGLFGTAVIPGDPTAALDLRVPTVAFSLQNSWLSIEEGGRTARQSTSRFPALGASYPVRTWGVLTVTYGGFLDQRWSFEQDRELDVGTGARTAVTDQFVSDGGIAALRLGFARRVSRRIGLGGSLGTYTGNTLRRFTRTFDSLGVNVPITPYQTGGHWTYSGAVADASVMIDVADVVRASASAAWSSSLTAKPDSATDGSKKTYDLPLQLRAGLSARLASGLNVSASAAYADWTDAGADLAQTTAAGSAVSVGAGVEFDQASLFGRSLPVRLGWRRSELPFRVDAGDPVESAFGGGVGLLLARAADVPLARLDFSIERGSRSGGAIGEDFWRSTVTFRAAGF